MADLGGESPTVLDPGRVRPAAAAVTVLDPGRIRPEIGGPSLAEALPPLLDARYAIVRTLDVAQDSGEQATFHLVRERTTGDERVVKLYPDSGRDRRLQAFLIAKQDPHAATVFEADTEDGRDYEVMEHLAGGNLDELLRRHARGLDAAVVRSMVEQLTSALDELHQAGFVHRDVKPSNIMVRTLTPCDVALADFGVCLYHPMPGPLTDGVTGTARFRAPEFLAGRRMGPAYDWWGLGLTVRELATGTPYLLGVTDSDFAVHIGATPIMVEDIVDTRLRLLCRGLLALRDHERWGADEIRLWLAGESPPVPVYGAPAGSGAVPVEIEEGYSYLDYDYFNREALARRMNATWSTAYQLLYAGDVGELARLEAWLRLYSEAAVPTEQSSATPRHVRLLRLLRHMSPAIPPLYRGVNISTRTLPALADQARAGEGDAREIVFELWEHWLLPLLASGNADVNLDGGSGLDTVHERWRDRWLHWDTAAYTVQDAEAQARLTSRNREMMEQRRALCLWYAVADDALRAEEQEHLEARARTLRVPWFTDMVENPELVWLARGAEDLAADVAEARDEAERAAARTRAWLARNARFREWSRRQNRPLALSWGAAGVAVMAALCAALIGASDCVGAVPGSTVVRAWVCTVLALTVALAGESVLAWEIGGRFHPRFSLLGSGFIVLGRAAGSVAGRGIALFATAAVLGGLYSLTVFMPVVTPVLLGVGAAVSAVARYLAWHRQSEREEADAARHRTEVLAAARR